jgi:exopolysaccharide biosynthesis polyprenyl glycosylphosphotransferase
MRASLLEKLLLILGDALVLLGTFVLAYWVQFHSGWISDKFDPSKVLDPYLRAGVLLSLGWLIWFTMTGLYRRWLLESRFLQIIKVARAVGVGIGFAMVALFGLDLVAWAFAVGHGTAEHPSFLYGTRFYLILGYGISLLVGLSAVRMLISVVLRAVFSRGYGPSDKLLVLGVTDQGKQIVDQFRKNRGLGHEVVGFVDERQAVLDENIDGLPVLGKYSDLKRIVKEKKVKGLVISHQSNSHNEILRIMRLVVDLPIHIYVVPDLYDVISGHFHSNLVHGVELKELFPQHMPAWQVRFKRFMDIAVAALLLFLSLPLTLFSAFLIRRDGGPIFYSQERVGLYGKKFMVHKFRTMRVDAEKGGPQWAKKHDDRITPVGKFLRRSRIDEIPQLWCVLKGDMSMVGPRPEREFFIEQLKKEIPLYVSRMKMKPGLTGWAQVRHHYDTSIEDVEEKLKYDLYYFENMSLLLDLQILFRTVWVVLTGHGAQ